MALSIGELAGYLTLDDSQFEKGLKGAHADFEKTGSKLAASADKYGKMAGKALVAGLVAAGAAAYKMTQSASDLAETMNKSEVIFGKNASTIDKWAATAATKMGMSKQAALEAAAGFGDMFTQLGFAGTQAAKMSQNVVQMSADLGSFNNLPTAEVADMMSAAFRGEYDSLQRLIPNINAARVESAALAATGKENAKALTAQEKAAAVLAIVQKDGARAAGDFARTSDGLANQQKILTARFADFQAELGMKLLPIMTKLSGEALKMLDWIDRNQKTVLILVSAVGSLTAAVWLASVAIKAVTVVSKVAAATTKGYAAAKTLLGKAALGTRLQLLALRAQTVATTAATALATGAMKAWTLAQKALNLAMRANPIGIVITLLAALGAGLVMAYKKSETFRRVVGVVWDSVKEKTRSATLWIADKVLWMAEKMLGAMATAFSWVPGLGDKMKSAHEAIKGFREDVNAEMDKISNEDVKISLRTQAIGKLSPKDFAMQFGGEGGAGKSHGGHGGGHGGPGLTPHVSAPRSEVRSAAGVVSSQARLAATLQAREISKHLARNYTLGTKGKVLPRGAYSVGMPYLGYPGHYGADYPAPTGTPVYAVAAGIVSRALSLTSSYGKHAFLEHAGGRQTRYAHLSSLLVRAGESVRAGQRIGSVGSTGNSTGPHLHYEDRVNGSPRNPANLGIFDTGGLARGAGLMVKGPKPERVLSPYQTEFFEKAMAAAVARPNGERPIQIENNFPTTASPEAAYEAAGGRILAALTAAGV